MSSSHELEIPVLKSEPEFKLVRAEYPMMHKFSLTCFEKADTNSVWCYALAVWCRAIRQRGYSKEMMLWTNTMADLDITL